MDRLIALPVKGESFLLRRENKIILVDGGYNSKELAKFFKAYDPTINYIDIVVCTHADGDHARGLGEFIDESKLRIGEFWLPGKWLDSVEELLFSPRRVMDGLVEELDNFDKDFLLGNSQEETSEAITAKLDERAIKERKKASERQEKRSGDNIASQQFNRLREKYNEISQIKGIARRSFESARKRIQYRRKKQMIQPALAHYWLGLVDTAESIRNIAEQAIKHHVTVRWFDFQKFSEGRKADGGDPGLLEALNSVESAPLPLQGISYFARLTAVNEECLAFLAPPYDNRLGVIFCGDSPMGNGPGYSNTFLNDQPESLLYYPIVATAPHHGSESNAIAYSNIKSRATVVTWLRTGGSIKQPGATFKSIIPELRACSHCPQTDRKHGVVEISLSCPAFFPHWFCFIGLEKIAPHRCDCR